MSFIQHFLSQASTHGKPECIIASNRGPIEYYAEPDGTFHKRYGSGGLITALLGAIQHRHIVWIALAMSKADRTGMRTHHYTDEQLPSILDNISLQMLNVSQKAYRRYYYNISNHLLWFAQHELLDPAMTTTFTQKTQDDWEQGYCLVNETIARAVIKELTLHGPETPVILQDYQLYLVAGHIRKQYPQARIGHVIYIPWPDARYMAMLPDYMTQRIYRSMAMNDFIGFQTLNDARNFLMGATRFLENAHIQWDDTDTSKPGKLFWQGRSVQICLHPAMLSPQYLHSVAQSQEIEVAVQEISTQINEDDNKQLILRVDRVEPTKNIIRGFQAYERLLQTHPELHKCVTFLALLVPSRESLAKYRLYEHEVRNIIARINTQFGQEGWQPIVAAFGNNRIRALAYLQRYDVLLVNPVVDGMNLVVKEGAILNKRSGVTILSCTTGAYDTIGNHVLGITPLDVDATAETLYRALIMPFEERKHHADKVREVLLQEDARQWFDVQLQDLCKI